MVGVPARTANATTSIPAQLAAVVQAGESPLQLGPKAEVSKASNTNPMSFLFRLLLGSAAGLYYFMLPWYMWVKNLVWPKNAPGF